MKYATPLITCSTCDGRGQVPLHAQLLDAFNIVRAMGTATAEQVFSALGLRGHIAVTAINNRLEQLRRLNLLNRTAKDGRSWLYGLPPSVYLWASSAAVRREEGRL